MQCEGCTTHTHAGRGLGVEKDTLGQSGEPVPELFQGCTLHELLVELFLGPFQECTLHGLLGELFLGPFQECTLHGLLGELFLGLFQGCTLHGLLGELFLRLFQECTLHGLLLLHVQSGHRYRALCRLLKYSAF